MVSKSTKKAQAAASRARIFTKVNAKTVLKESLALFGARKTPNIAAMVGAPKYQGAVDKAIAGVSLGLLKSGGKTLTQMAIVEAGANLLEDATPIIDNLLGSVSGGRIPGGPTQATVRRVTQ